MIIGEDLLLKLLGRFADERVEYVLVGGQAVRLNGFLRATEIVDVLLRSTRGNGERVKRALDFLRSAKTDYREKDVLDKRVLMRIKQGLAADPGE